MPMIGTAYDRHKGVRDASHPRSLDPIQGKGPACFAIAVILTIYTSNVRSPIRIAIRYELKYFGTSPDINIEIDKKREVGTMVPKSNWYVDTYKWEILIYARENIRAVYDPKINSKNMFERTNGSRKSRDVFDVFLVFLTR